ncbi:unnamed protein product [Sphagnum troendelagicum]|uniref:Protein MULTIPLE CHLOROPLAST DIVISION SITE 1 n=1 Tax=Sphagnum troendelagicum TaxID=128251 RepID=A0ABP0TDM0_9BRYO
MLLCTPLPCPAHSSLLFLDTGFAFRDACCEPRRTRQQELLLRRLTCSISSRKTWNNGIVSLSVGNGWRREKVAATATAGRTVFVNAEPSGDSSVADEGKFSSTFRQVHGEKNEPHLENERMESSVAASVSPQTERGLPMNLAAGVGVTAAVFMMAVLGFLAKPRENQVGSVSDLVKRGQLRSDRGADSRTLKFEDPFNYPLVKVGKKNPIVKMCGKLFRLAPVTLTEEKRASHQNRRVQAYKWKRPSLFLVEGEPVPEGVDPEEVRWIPSNHPFATTKNYIEEGLAQQNMYQTRGVPSRVKAEHEALRKKMMEATSKEPEFQFPDSSKQQWGGTPSADNDMDQTEGRRQSNTGREMTGDNGSFRLRNIDGSEVSDPGPTTLV